MAPLKQLMCYGAIEIIIVIIINGIVFVPFFVNDCN